MPEAKFRLTQIYAIMLGVREVARSVEFYRDKLGMAVKFQSAEFAFLDGGGVTLALSLPLASAGGQAAGTAEVVFSVNDVRAAYEALGKQGIQFTREPRNVAGESWAANFDDPDGHHLSIFGPERKA